MHVQHNAICSTNNVWSENITVLELEIRVFCLIESYMNGSVKTTDLILLTELINVIKQWHTLLDSRYSGYLQNYPQNHLNIQVTVVEVWSLLRHGYLRCIHNWSRSLSGYVNATYLNCVIVYHSRSSCLSSNSVAVAVLSLYFTQVEEKVQLVHISSLPPKIWCIFSTTQCALLMYEANILLCLSLKSGFC